MHWDQMLKTCLNQEQLEIWRIKKQESIMSCVQVSQTWQELDVFAVFVRGISTKGSFVWRAIEHSITECVCCVIETYMYSMYTAPFQRMYIQYVGVVFDQRGKSS